MTPDVSWQPLSIDATGAPPSQLDRTGAVALIPAGDRAWAAGAAVTLARSLARGGRRVFLCDLDLATPRLHTMVGLDRGSGVSDFILYGASPSHVSVELEERLLFVPAGTPVTAFEEVYGDERWSRFVEAATHARACLLLFVPADVRGAARILGRAETLVALGNPAELPDLGGAADRLRCGFHPQDLDEWDAGVDAGSSAGPLPAEPDDEDAAIRDETGLDETGTGDAWVDEAWDHEAEDDEAEDDEAGHDEAGEGSPGAGVEWTLSGAVDEAPPEAAEMEDPAAEALRDGPVIEAPEGDPDPWDSPSEAERWTTAEEVATESRDVDAGGRPGRWTADEGVDAEPGAADDEVDVDPWTADEAEVMDLLDEGYSTGEREGFAAGGDDESIPVREAWVRGDRPERKTAGIGLWLVLFLVVVVALLAAGWLGWIDVPGISPRRADLESEARIEAVRSAGAAAPESPAPPAPVEDGVPEGEGVPAGSAGDDESGPSVVAASPHMASSSEVVAPLQGWALRIGAYRGRSVARSEADRLAARAPNHLFVVVPVEVAGTRWYRVVSGLAPDRDAGERLRGDLALALQSAEADQWLVRRAPLAFLIDEREVVGEAERRVDELGRAGIDAYVMAADRTDGSRVFRVYAGAFADATEASTMGDLLASLVDLTPPLVERRGTRPE